MAVKLELDDKEVAVIGKLLHQAPYHVAMPIITSIQRQIDASNAELEAKANRDAEELAEFRAKAAPSS